MAKQIKTKTVKVTEKEGAFTSLFKIRSEKKETEISKLRQLLSDEKARLLHIARTKQPDSIYMLAKVLGRDFKAVRHDVKLLEEYGFIELITSRKHGRERLKPVVDADQIVITVNL